MAKRVLHELFPGERVVIKRHSPCADSHGAGDAVSGLVVSVRATETPPFFWYCIQYPEVKKSQARDWYAERFLQLPYGPLKPRESGIDDAEDALRVRVGSDVLLLPRNGPEPLVSTPETLYRVCEMFIRNEAFKLPAYSLKTPINEIERHAKELTHCTVVNRLGRTLIARLLELVPSVTGAVVAKHVWNPLVPPRWVLRGNFLQTP